MQRKFKINSLKMKKDGRGRRASYIEQSDKTNDNHWRFLNPFYHIRSATSR